MKKILTIIGLFAFVQTASSQSMGSQGILGKLRSIIDFAEDAGKEVVRVEADLIRTTKECTRRLDPSFTYTVTAVGSNRIEDLDIEVYKKVQGSWTLVERDNDNSNIAIVTINPDVYEDYKVIVKAYKFLSNYEVGHYGLVFVHD